MHVPRLRRPSRVRGGILGIVTALILAFPVGVLAGATFNDVPTTNIFYNDVEALVASGVTAGCGGGNYCPNAFVTRGQMAAFMNRLGALASDKTPVVNADRVDGYHANGLTRTSIGLGLDTYTALTTTFAPMASVTIQVPGPGFVTVVASSTLIAQSGCPCTAITQLRRTSDNATSPLQLQEVGAGLAYASIANNHVFSVAGAGSHTFALDAMHYTAPGGTGSFGPFDTVLTAQYSPFGSTGGSTLSEGGLAPAGPATETADPIGTK